MKKHIAVVGTGYWGKNLVRNFHALGALHTVCDTDAQVLQTMVDQYPGVQGVSGFSDVLVDPAIEGVAIATPAVAHADMIREALLAGKDVYVEKPLCLSERDGQEITTLARDGGRVLMVGHLLWHHPAVFRLKDLITNGELGRIQYIYSNRLNLGKLRREENVLWSFAPHDVSVILGLLDDEMPESIQAQGGNYLHQRIADTTVSLLNFASGVRAHIFVSWLHPYKEQKLVVVGDQKMAVFDDTAPWGEKLLLYPHRVKWSGNVPVANKADAERVEVTEQEPLRAECQHFLECMRTRSTPRTDGEEGLRVLKVLNACQEALERQGMIVLGRGAKRPDYYVHDSAVVDEGVEIGAGSKIWHFSHILTGSKIGRNCIIGQNVMIGPDVVIGDKCKVQNNVSIYKGVTLEDGVFCGPSCVFTNVNTPRAEIERKDEFLATRVRRGVTIGANATIVCGVDLGEYSTIGAGAVVTKDIPAFALVAGVPARQIGWVSHTGDRLGPDLVCPRTGKRYIELAPDKLEELTEDSAGGQPRKRATKS